MKGWVKEYRALLNWEHFKKPLTAHLWEYIRLKANHEDVVLNDGTIIKKGTFLTSLNQMCKETGLTKQQLRTALKNLSTPTQNSTQNSTQEITQLSTQHGTLIKVNKWGHYQVNECVANTPPNTQTNTEINTLSNTKQEDKEVKELKVLKEESEKLKSKNKEINKQIKEINKRNLGEYKNVKLTDDEYSKLMELYGRIETDLYIKFLDEYIEEKGYKSKSHYLAIKRWVVNAVKEKEGKSQRIEENNRPIETLTVYDDSNNPKLDLERLKELERRRQNK